MSGQQLSKEFYKAVVDDTCFFDCFDGHVLLEEMPDWQYEGVVQAVFDRAGRERDGLTGFQEWFYDTSHFDDLWDVLRAAIDDYIDMVVPEILRDGDWEPANCDLEG